MIDKCDNCGKCCIDTEMAISMQDIENILINYPDKLMKDNFTIKISTHYYQLKNIDGHCFFFDNISKLCKIYEFRPQGCKFYPIIYDSKKKRCIYDDYCPRTELFLQNKQKFKITCQKLIRFIKEQLRII